MVIFNDRHTAGRLLASRLQHLAQSKPIVLALPRGGVPIGMEIAKTLQCEFDIFIVKRLTTPEQPELAIGAVAEGGHFQWDLKRRERAGVSGSRAIAILQRKQRQVAKKAQVFRGNREALDVRGRTLILTDDGLATGMSMKVAIEALRKKDPAQIIVAVPVSPAAVASEIRRKVDDLIVLAEPKDFFSVSQWYADFTPVKDREVVAWFQNLP